MEINPFTVQEANTFRILDKDLIDYMLSLKMPLRQSSTGEYFMLGWTQGVAAIDLFNTNNCATYLCCFKGNESVGVKAYFNQFEKIV
jgi:hypothetical protein